MVQTIRGLGATGVVLGNMVIPTAPTSGADTKTSFTQLLNFFNVNSFLNSTKVEVDTLNGNDTTGTGSASNPFLTVFHAESTITDASASKLYAIIVTGTVNELTRVAKPYVAVVGNSVLTSFFNFTTVTLHSSWNTAPTGAQGGFENCMLSSSVDLSLITPPANSQFIINNANVSGSVSGTLGPQWVVKNTAVNATVSLVDTGCIRISSPQFGALSLTRSTVPVTHIAEASSFFSSYDLTGNVDNIYDAISYKVPNIISGTPTFSPISVGNGTDANFTPSNYTPVDASVTGNLKGIDAALFGIVSNPSTTLIWVDVEGVDAVGRGFYGLPYATISYAQSQILDHSKLYNILVTSNISDTGQIYSLPNVKIMALSNVTVTTPNPIILHSSWSGTNLKKSSFDNINYSSGFSLDFTSAGATNPSIYFKSMDIVPVYPSVIGYASGINPLTKLICENCTGYSYGYDINYTGINNAWTEVSIGTDDPLSAKTGIIIDSFNESSTNGGFFASGYQSTIALPTVTSSFKLRNLHSGDGYQLYIVSASDQLVEVEATSSSISILSPQINAEGYINFRITNSKIQQLNYFDYSASGSHISYATDLSSYPTIINPAGFFNPNILDINYITTDATVTSISLQVGRTYQANTDGENIYDVPVLSKIGGEVNMQIGDITGSIKIQCNLGQRIFFGSQVTTTGTSGFITMTSTDSPHGSFTLRNISTDSGDWVVVNCQGVIGVQV